MKTVAAAAATAVAMPAAAVQDEGEEDLSDSYGEGRILQAGDGPPYGGGQEYVEETDDAGFTEEDADYVVEDADELVKTLDSDYCTPQPGEVVFVPGDAEIDTGTRNEIPIPPGVTLASDRGVDGSDGGLIYEDSVRDTAPPDPYILAPEDDVRISGLRVRGKYWNTGRVESGGEKAPHDEYITGVGITAEGRNVEVENCEVYGFGYAAIAGSRQLEVHHCDIHDTLRSGLGYGVLTENAEIHHNTFNRNRHAVAASGSSGSTYEAHHNVVGDYTIGHIFDVHQPGGERYEFHHNTVRASHYPSGMPAPSVTIRDVPDDLAWIHNNWFYNPLEPRENPDGWTREAIRQVFVDEWTNVEWQRNHYGDDEKPPKGVGAPGAERVVFP